MIKYIDTSVDTSIDTSVDTSIDTYICNPCNCECESNISKDIFIKYPHANIYDYNNKKNLIPGNIIIKDKIINMLVQITPAKPNYSYDSSAKRLCFFKSCLNQISKSIPSNSTIIFPSHDKYDEYIKLFALQNSYMNIFICKRFK